MITAHSVALRRRSKYGGSGKARVIQVLRAGSEPSSAAVGAAERLVVACRENVRFLNRHLQRFRAYLELPPYVDNALYLAYTVRVKSDSPFGVVDLRRHLHRAGVETTSAFSFIAGENFDIVRNESAPQRSGRPKDDRSFCIACHQYLTIPDLEHIVDSLESFFAGINSDIAKPEKPGE